MKKVVLVLGLVCLVMTVVSPWPAAAGSYNFITAPDLKKRMDGNSPLVLVDICSPEQFAKGHIKGSIETNAYPVKTEEERARLAQALPRLKDSSDDVIIVCPGGGGGAKRAYDFYKSSGIDEKRLLILEKGMDKWPYETDKK